MDSNKELNYDVSDVKKTLDETGSSSKSVVSTF